jgi:putative PIG3 family NAD(P)H quinone oxidoreductase
VADLEPGQWVCALLAGGGYAQFAVAPAQQCLPIPAGLSAVQAASLPETVFTVWHNVFDQGAFQAGDTVLIHGGSSGIGVMAIQMVAALGGRAIATAGSDDKTAACRTLGAETAINYRTADFVQEVLAATDGRGADIILDMVGGDYLPRNIAAAAIGGRVLHIAYLRGARAEIDLAKVMQKQLIITGSTLRSRSVADKGRIRDRLAAQVWPAMDQGRIRPVIDAVYPLAGAADAHRRLEAAEHIGKIVLDVEGDRA